MGKYDQLKILKKTKARTNHICNICGNVMPAGDFYFKEHIQDKLLGRIASGNT